MVALIVTAIILIIIMLIFIFILFKSILKRIEDNARRYFINKMQDYDYVVELKRKELDNLKNEIAEIEEKNINILEKNDDEVLFNANNKHNLSKSTETNNKELHLNFNVPDYREVNFFNNYKEIKKVFSVNNERIIKEFVEKNKNVKEEKEYKELLKIREKFDNDTIYHYITLSSAKQYEMLNESLTAKQKKILKIDKLNKDGKFTIKTFINDIENKMEQIEPIIYVYVNNENEDYNYIDENIVTKRYENMSEGIIIKYRNKIYDYSI